MVGSRQVETRGRDFNPDTGRDDTPRAPRLGPVVYENYRDSSDVMFYFEIQAHIRNRYYEPSQLTAEKPQEIFVWNLTDCGLIYTLKALTTIGAGDADKGAEIVRQYLENLRKNDGELVSALAKAGVTKFKTDKNPWLSEIMEYSLQKIAEESRKSTSS
jgi:hypothetical protein